MTSLMEFMDLSGICVREVGFRVAPLLLIFHFKLKVSPIFIANSITVLEAEINGLQFSTTFLVLVIFFQQSWILYIRNLTK